MEEILKVVAILAYLGIGLFTGMKINANQYGAPRTEKLILLFFTITLWPVVWGFHFVEWMKERS